MKFTLDAKVPTIDLEGYRNKLHEYMSQKLKDAAKKWLENTAHYIPVWSGASRSTFSPLASRAEYTLSISPKVNARVHFEMDFGTAEWVTDPMAGRYQFSYVTTLPHLYINENYDARQWGFHLKNPGPYHFQARGDTAFRMFAETITLPNIKPFIHSVTI